MPAARAWSAALAAVAAVVLTGCGGPLTVTPSAASKLSAIAARTARKDGGHLAASASAVATTRSRAFTSLRPLTSGAIPAGHGSAGVYLVTMTGRFVAFEPSAATGAHFGAGSYLSLIIDPGSYRVIGWKLSTRPPRVKPASLGHVTDLRETT